MAQLEPKKLRERIKAEQGDAPISKKEAFLSFSLVGSSSTPSAHASTHKTGGSDVIADVVADQI